MTTRLPEIRRRSTSARGERLYPKTTSRLYWHLTCLRSQYETILANYLNGDTSCTVVDFGCGNMPYRPLFEENGCRYLGCDLPGNEAADCIMLEPNVLPLEQSSADIVLSSQVLEHVDSPALYLAEAHRVLRPDGLLLLSTHGVWRFHPDPHDFWRWTCAGLRREIEKAHFEIESFSGVMGPESTALQLYQDAVLNRIPQWLRPYFIWWMQLRIRRADRRCSSQTRDKDACVYVVVSRKVTNK